MNQRKSTRIPAASTLVLAITLATGTVAFAQGTSSQTGRDSDSPAQTNSTAPAQEPADAQLIHEGAGPIDCARVLGQDNATGRTTQAGDVSRTDGASLANADAGTSPYRGDQPGADTQVSTAEECRSQQNAMPDAQPDGARTE